MRAIFRHFIIIFLDWILDKVLDYAKTLDEKNKKEEDRKQKKQEQKEKIKNAKTDEEIADAHSDILNNR